VFQFVIIFIYLLSIIRLLLFLNEAMANVDIIAYERLPRLLASSCDLPGMDSGDL
jgi:hypothetical protein